MLGRGGRSFSDRSPKSSLQLAISFPELLVLVYQLVLALKAANLGIIVCADLAVCRSLHTHETIGRSVWDWLHNGDVHEDSPILSLLSLFASQFCPSLGCGIAFVTVFGISVLRVRFSQKGTRGVFQAQTQKL